MKGKKQTILMFVVFILLGCAIYFVGCGKNPLTAVLGGAGGTSGSGNFTVGMGKL